MIEIINHIESTGETYKQALNIIAHTVKSKKSKTDKAIYLDQMIMDLKHNQELHQEVCPEKEKSPPVCDYDLNYDKVIKWCKDSRSLYLPRPEHLGAEYNPHKNPRINPAENDVNTNSAISNKNDGKPTASLQRKGIWVAIILFILNQFYNYLISKGYF